MMTRAELETRRLAAVQDIEARMVFGRLPGGYSSDLARKYKVSRTTIGRWRSAVEDGLPLAARPAPGRPRRLSQAQEAMISELYALGPRACAIEAKRWTQATFTVAIQDATGVQYDSDHVGRIMHRLGLTVPRPRAIKSERRAGVLPGVVS
jgi:transposase